jgi:hypothetical protein
MANILKYFFPFGKAKFTACAIMASLSLTGSALSTSYYANSSRLKSGTWAKIRVSNEGMQQITYAQLKEWGFSNPENVKVYGYGGTWMADHVFSEKLPDDIQPTLCIHTSDGRILFFGDCEARAKLSSYSSSTNISDYTVDRNYFSNYGYYLITDANVGGDIPEAAEFVSSGEIAPLSSHVSVTLNEDEAIPTGNNGCVFVSKKYSPGESITTKFNITDYDNTSSYVGTVTMEMPTLNVRSYRNYTFQSIACDKLSLTQQGSCTIGYNIDGSLTYYATSAKPQTASITKIAPADGEETIADGEYEFSIPIPDSEAGYLTFVSLDRAVITYPRKNLKRPNEELIMHFPLISNGDNFVVSGATENTRVWNVSTTGKIYEQEGLFDKDANTFTGSFNQGYNANETSGECRLVAFNLDETYNAVEFDSKIENQDIHADSTPDLVIITTPELIASAEELADIHRKYDNMDVNVYTQDQLINEFGAGTPSAMALRRGLKMLYDRNPEKLKYLILYGKSFFDYRQLSDKAGYTPLMTFEVEPINANMCVAAAYSKINFCSDDYFGYLDDGDSPANMLTKGTTVDLCVSRITCKDEAAAAKANKKILDYIQNPLPADVMMRTLLLSDNGDNNEHLQQSVNLTKILSANNTAITAVQAHNMIYPHTTSDAPALRNAEIKALNDGIGLYCYNGHGAETAFAAENIWTVNYANSTSYKYVPIAMLATCSAICIDQTGTTIGDAMFQKVNGGAIAVIGTNRSVWLDANKYIYDSFVNAYSSSKGTIAIGELYRTAHNNANNNYDFSLRYRANTMCYCMIGDCALKIRLPEQNIKITEIKGIDIDGLNGDNSSLNLSPMASVKIKAEVLDANGKLDSNYNGTANITLYEAPRTVDVFKVDDDDDDATVTLDQDVLNKSIAAVKNGKIETTMFVPYNIYESTAENPNRITVIATATDGTTASGANQLAYILSDDDEPSYSGSLPSIDEMYINDAQIAEDDIVSSSPTLYAIIEPGDAGLSVSNSIGNQAFLALDGSKVVEGSLPIELSADGTASLQYSLSDVSDGEHSLTLSLVDNVGNRVEKTINFTVGTVVNLSADKYNVHDNIEFTLDHTYADTPDCRLIIEDAQKRTVLSIEKAAFPYTLDIEKLNDGFYSAYILTNGSNVYRATQKVDFVVTH